MECGEWKNHMFTGKEYTALKFDGKESVVSWLKLSPQHRAFSYYV